MSIARADLDTAISVASVIKSQAYAHLQDIRGTSDFAAYAQALEQFMVADLEHLELVSMRERQRADEVAAMAEEAGL